LVNVSESWDDAWQEKTYHLRRGIKA
jgi:hypothetical protein